MECSDLDENVKMLFCTVNKWPENYKDSFKKYYYGLQSFLCRRVCTNCESSQAPCVPGAGDKPGSFLTSGGTVDASPLCASMWDLFMYIYVYRIQTPNFRRHV